MILNWLELREFRSYATLDFAPDEGINLLVGPNGAGKTNLLEGIAYLSRLRSFRRVADEALVQMGRAAAVVRGEFERDGGSLRVEVEIPQTGRRRVQVNGKRPGRLAEVAAEVPIVTFLPDDLDMVKGGPARRREYLDELSSQLWPAAGAELTEFEQSLRQRNALLRTEGPSVDAATLDVWDESVAATGAAVVVRRADLLARLAGPLAGVYGEIGPGPDSLHSGYAPRGAGHVDAATSVGDVDARLQDALAARRRVDIERRVTTVGPHRDDVTVYLGERDTRTLASQGEQRSVALVLRLAADALLREKFNAPPILVLDDVFSELDAQRSAGVVARLPGGQVFISSAREEDVPVSGRTWRVREGQIQEERVA